MPYYTEPKTHPPMLFRINYSDDLDKEDKVMVLKWSSINAVVKKYTDRTKEPVIRIYFQDTWYQFCAKTCPDAVTLFETWNNCATLPAIS
jgi:hypothetical protein